MPKVNALNFIRTERGDDPKNYIMFLDPSGNVLFMQWRKDGEKPDLPFSCWDDGEWRDGVSGLLPLYGLEKLKTAVTIFLHEGAAGARKVQTLVDTGGAALAAHPWANAISQYTAHLGWPGGVNRARDVDWEPIRKLEPDRRVIVVADNDQGGVEAVTEISRLLQRPLTMLQFDDRFPETFDLANPWPQRPEWWKGPKYIGPSFDDCLRVRPSRRGSARNPRAKKGGRQSLCAKNLLPSGNVRGRPRHIRAQAAEQPAIVERNLNLTVRPFLDARIRLGCWPAICRPSAMVWRTTQAKNPGE